MTRASILWAMLFAGAASVTALAIGPAPNSLPPDCGSGETPVNLAVLAEGFTQRELGVFKSASRTLICGGAFHNDPVYSSHPDSFRATDVPLVSAGGLTATPGSGTALQVGYTGARKDCFFTTN